MMTGEQLVSAHRALLEKMHETCKSKNSDYAGQGGATDAFANLRMVETLSKGALSTEQGIITRMTDKFSRLVSLLTSGKEAQVKNESIDDTLIDLANYALLMVLYREDKARG